MDSEDDFLRVAYQEYINAVEEWPNFKNMPEREKYTGCNREPMPLLIMECSRLVPVKNNETGHFDYHPFNMPDTVLRNIQIIGTVVGIANTETYKEIRVCDGTGTMSVFYKIEDYLSQVRRREKIDSEHKVSKEDAAKFERRMKINVAGDRRWNPSMERLKKYYRMINENPHETLSQKKYDFLCAGVVISRFQVEKKLWWEKCQHGMLGKALDLGSYVIAEGFCNVKIYENFDKTGDTNPWKSNVMPMMMFNAYNVKSISEKNYNDTLDKWVNGIVKKKYTVDLGLPNSPAIMETE